MKENYSYPINPEWQTDELLIVMDLWQILESTYENSVLTEDFMAAYRQFKTVVKSIGEERQLSKQFEALSGYSLYQVVKRAQQQKTGKLRMKECR